jgi:phosphopantothenoylcysteine decarboxylase / phosphopantothenate---cysteine ligase
LAGIETIARAVCKVLGIQHDLDGETILITAGPTCEDLDPVRYLTNRSSGKMGYSLAAAAQRRGAHVILVSGPTDLPTPEGVDWIPVRTTSQMRDAVIERAPHATIIIKAAAVADYRPVAAHQHKMKRGSERITLELEPTPDILAELGRTKSSQILIGFAAETENVAASARAKLARKNADMIVANDVTQEGAGFDTDTNVVTLYLRNNQEIPLPKLSKQEVAEKILNQALELRRQTK